MKKVTAFIMVIMLLACSVMAPIGVVAADEPSVNIVAASLSLEDNVYIWFDMALTGAELETADCGMIFWTAEQAAGQYTYANAGSSSQAIIKSKSEGSISYDEELKCDVATFKYGVAAKEMTDMVYAQAYVKTSSGYAYSTVVPYSVQTYAARKLGLVSGVNGTTDEKLKTLLRDMLDYGASAQIYFNYKTDNLANAILNPSTSTTTYTVTFVDHDGTTLKTQTVNSGEAATAPTDPKRDGYIFDGWDKTFDNVTGDLTVTAQYKKITAPSIMVNSTTANVSDETVTVTISLLNNPGISSLRFDISYDDILTLDSVSFDEAYGTYVTAPTPYENPQKVTFISPLADVGASGTFATLKFSISNTVTADTVASITITSYPKQIYDVNFNEVDFDVINGSVSFRTN